MSKSSGTAKLDGSSLADRIRSRPERPHLMRHRITREDIDVPSFGGRLDEVGAEIAARLVSLGVDVANLDLAMGHEPVDDRALDLEPLRVGGTPFRRHQRPAQVFAHHRDAQRPGKMGERTDQRRVLLGAHLLEQAHRDQEQGRLVVVELQGREQAALADPPATAGLLDVDARVVAQRGHVSLDGPRVDLELLGKLPRCQADLGLAQPREQLDDPKLFLTLLIDAWHATSLTADAGVGPDGQRVTEERRPRRRCDLPTWE